jgi:hypothetical protein
MITHDSILILVADDIGKHALVFAPADWSARRQRKPFGRPAGISAHPSFELQEPIICRRARYALTCVNCGSDWELRGEQRLLPDCEPASSLDPNQSPSNPLILRCFSLLGVESLPALIMTPFANRIIEQKQ